MYIANRLENLLINHWPESSLNWHGTFLGQEDLNEVRRVTNGPTPERGQKGELFFKKSFSDEPVDQRQNYLARIIPMICRYKIVQLLSLGLHITPP